jgi:hypothetical protein
MRTTLDIDEDILLTAKQLARQRGTTAGRVLSDLARQALEPKKGPKKRNGVPLFVPKPGAKRPHLELVNRLRDES